ncbi:MAG: hypothetical protein ACYSTS_17400 [Planctomycetota bacterium]|jgi:hypothetical protein
MILSKEALEEFKVIYKKEVCETLSDKDAHEMATRLLRLFQLLRYKPRQNLTDFESNDNINR